MKTDNEFLSTMPRDGNNTMLGYIVIPVAVAAVPAGLFTLLGLIAGGFDKPGVEPPVWVAVAMIAVQTLGMISMAFVILVRFDLAFGRLMIFTNRQPHVWRKCVLTLSMGYLLMFDTLTNVSAAFSGAGFLLVGAVPAFVAYLLCNCLAFAGLGK